MGRPLRVSLARTARHSEAKEGGSGGASRPPDPPASTDVVTVARQASETNVTVHVGNLVGTETEENMRNAFKEFGQIDNIRVPGKNFGFVAFTTHLAAAAAIASKNGSTPAGFTRPLRCTWASERRNPTTTPAAPGGAAMPPPPPGLPPGAPPPPGGYVLSLYQEVWCCLTGCQVTKDGKGEIVDEGRRASQRKMRHRKGRFTVSSVSIFMYDGVG